MPWVYVAIIVAGASGFIGGWVTQDWRFTAKIATIHSKHDKERVDLAERARSAESKNRKIETEMREAADREREKSREKVRAIDKRLSAALVELRKRPERTNTPSGEVPDTSQTCAGVSGAELARGDAGFLVGYSADAAKQREALRICETQYEAVRIELNKE